MQKIVDLIDKILDHPEMLHAGWDELKVLRNRALTGEIDCDEMEIVIELAEMLMLIADRSALLPDQQSEKRTND